MNDENRFFSLNHAEHFQTGLCHPAAFISRSFDTKERDMAWHRATIQIEGRFSLSFYASNSKRVCLNDGTVCDLDKLISNKQLTAEEKADVLLDADFWEPEQMEARDVLLCGFKGRYLWLRLKTWGEATVSRIRLYYPHVSFMRYLPESYQIGTGSFLDRFTAMFQSLYLDLDEKIERFHTRLDPYTADSAALGQLAEWLGLHPFLPLREDRLRVLIAKASELFHIWGTKQSLSKIMEIICGGIKPFIKEDVLSFTVLLPNQDDMDVPSIHRAIEAVKPAHTSYTLVLLRQALVLDSHTYIGVNSRLKEYAPPRLDNRTNLGIHSLIKSEERQHE